MDKKRKKKNKRQKTKKDSGVIYKGKLLYEPSTFHPNTPSDLCKGLFTCKNELLAEPM